MSRRTGPGGRLRPSPRSQRPHGRERQAPVGPRPEDDHLSVVGAEALDPEPLAAADEPFVSQAGATGVVSPTEAPGRADGEATEPDALRASQGAAVDRHGLTLEERRPARAEAIPDVAGARPAPAARAAAATAPSAGPTGEPGANQPPRDVDGSRPTCTAPQLRRFIKSRAYVPMHELRRRFSIDGDDDEVCPIDLEDGRIFVGLPAAEGRMLGELVRGGEVGYELSWDPRTPVVVGVYSMRPVSRA